MKAIKSQWVVQTTTKLSGWGWESFFKTKTEAEPVYLKRLADKSFRTVRLYKETWKVGAK